MNDVRANWIHGPGAGIAGITQPSKLVVWDFFEPCVAHDFEGLKDEYIKKYGCDQVVATGAAAKEAGATPA